MQTLRLLTYFMLFCISAGLIACSDHLVPAVAPGSAAVRLRVKTITQAMGLPDNQVKVSSFQYDNLGRLSSITANLSPDNPMAPVEQNTYQYDAQNRLILHQRTITRPSFYKGTIEQHKFTYNVAGQVAKIEYYNDTDSPGTPILTFTATPQFTSTNKLQAYQKILNPIFLRDKTSGPLLRRDLFLTNIAFTGDNLTAYHSQQIVDELIGGGFSTTDSDHTLTYDDKVNPFYGVYVIPFPNGYITDIRNAGFTINTYFGGLDNLLNLSRNNVLSHQTSNAPSLTTYTYTYNAANLPTSRTSSGAIVEKLNFDYEAY